MVQTEILEQALRGGEAARALEERCRQEMLDAEQAVKDAIAEAPDFIAETKERHSALLEDASSLNTQLAMLGESLDDITENSARMLERSKQEARKKKALDDLSTAIVPFVKVAEALDATDNVSNLTFQELEKALALINTAIETAQRSSRDQLIQTIPELQERSEQVRVTMKSRYIDMFEIRRNSVLVRSASSGLNALRGRPGEASAALAKAGLLADALSSIVSELLRNETALGLSRATMFFETEDNSGHGMEWSEGADMSGELLEFDLDDIEDVSDPELDAMSDNLDIANTAARALKIFDLLREKVVGEEFARELAFSLQPWLCNNVLPSSMVMSSNRTTLPGQSVSGDTLHARVTAISASAKVLQLAIRERGAHSFVLVVEMDSLESKVGSECRAQAMLKTRRAIASFANARHDNNEVETCPIAVDRYVPPERRPPEYFAPCIVTKTAIVVHEVFLSTRKDAMNASHGGSLGISSAMNAAALECLRAYREDVPVQHGDELRASLRLKALYFNDCTMLAHSCRLSAASTDQNSEMMAEAESLDSAAQKAMSVVRRTAERRLEENLNAACRNNSLGAYGTLTRIQRSSALSAAYQAMREVVSVFAEFVPTELAEIAACRLLEKYLTNLCNAVAALPEISENACQQIETILADADRNVNNLMNLVNGMDSVRAGASPPDAVINMRNQQKRMQTIRGLLNSRMEDIVTSYRSGKFNGLITREEVEHFIRAIFEDTDLRSNFISDLNVGLQQESTEWENDNW